MMKMEIGYLIAILMKDYNINFNIVIKVGDFFIKIFIIITQIISLIFIWLMIMHCSDVIANLMKLIYKICLLASERND